MNSKTYLWETLKILKSFSEDKMQSQCFLSHFTRPLLPCHRNQRHEKYLSTNLAELMQNIWRKLQNSQERHQGRPKKWKKYSIFMDRKIQCSQVLPNLTDRIDAIPNKILLSKLYWGKYEPSHRSYTLHKN